MISFVLWLEQFLTFCFPTAYIVTICFKGIHNCRASGFFWIHEFDFWPQSTLHYKVLQVLLTILPTIIIIMKLCLLTNIIQLSFPSSNTNMPHTIIPFLVLSLSIGLYLSWLFSLQFLNFLSNFLSICNHYIFNTVGNILYLFIFYFIIIRT